MLGKLLKAQRKAIRMDVSLSCSDNHRAALALSLISTKPTPH